MTGSNNSVESWMSWSVAENGEGTLGWPLGEGSNLSLGELMRIPGLLKASGAGPKAPFPVGLINEKKAFREHPGKGCQN